MIDRSAYDAKLLREARLALSLVSVLVVASAWLGYRYVTSFSPDRGIPRHVQQAPLATEVDAEFIAAATARRIDGIGDPSRASREYPSQNLPDGNPMRVASRTTADELSSREVDALRIGSNRALPTAVTSTSPAGEDRMPFTSQVENGPATADEISPQQTPVGDNERLEFQRRQFHPQPLVPPLQQSPNAPETSGLSVGNQRLRQAANSMRQLQSSPVAIQREAEPDPSPPAATIRMVNPQQSLWPIAQELYGNGQWFRALHEYNSDRYQRAGSSALAFAIECPSLEVLRAAFPQLDPTSGPMPAEAGANRNVIPSTTWYTTRESDTLFDIARTELGQAARYAELWELNQSRLPAEVSHLTRLPAGLQLQLPSTVQR